jgi:hypothetical protein
MKKRASFRLAAAYADDTNIMLVPMGITRVPILYGKASLVPKDDHERIGAALKKVLDLFEEDLGDINAASFPAYLRLVKEKSIRAFNRRFHSVSIRQEGSFITLAPSKRVKNGGGYASGPSPIKISASTGNAELGIALLDAFNKCESE